MRLSFETLERREFLDGNPIALNPLTPATALASFGTTGTLGPVAVTIPAGAIVIAASSSDAVVDAQVAAHPGATFYFQAGTYHNLTITPLAGDRFIGQLRTVLTSQTAASAFRSSAPNVTIENITVDGYVPVWPYSAIHADMATGWTVDHVEVRNSAMRGVTLFDGGKLTNSTIHDNAQLGVKVDGLAGYAGFPQYHTAAGTPVLISNDEISHNNPSALFDPTWEAGGIKLWDANNVTVTHCNVHDNYGAGIWTDTVRGGGVFSYNWSHDNFGAGLLNELTDGATIENNLLENNKAYTNTPFTNPTTWPVGAGLFIWTSSNVTVRTNTIQNNANAITITNSPRSDEGSVWQLDNVAIDSNTIVLTQGRVRVIWTGAPVAGETLWTNNHYTINLTTTTTKGTIHVASSALPGDLNGDGAFNNFDILPFEMVLNDPSRYLSLYGLADYQVWSDMNGDGVLDNFDIMAFEQALTGTHAASPSASLVRPLFSTDLISRPASGVATSRAAASDAAFASAATAMQSGPPQVSVPAPRAMPFSGTLHPIDSGLLDAIAARVGISDYPFDSPEVS